MYYLIDWVHGITVLSESLQSTHYLNYSTETINYAQLILSSGLGSWVKYPYCIVAKVAQLATGT